jgi:hypothetical protein
MLKVIQSDSIFQKYEWPLFVDSKSKLSSSNQRDIFGVDVKETLNNAISFLKLASEDKEYKIANLNLSIAHLLFDLSKEDTENDHLNESNYYLNKVSNLKLPQVSALKGIMAHNSGNLEEAKKIFLSEGELSPLSKRNYNKLFGKYQIINASDNPLSCLLKFDQNLIELFFEPKGIVRDSSNNGSKPLLPSFANISIDSKTTNNTFCSRIYDKSTNTKVYFAKLNDNYENISENLLNEYSDQIFESNLYKYFVFSDWIIRIDINKVKTVYKTR